MSAWITVIGVTDGGLEALPAESLALIEAAQVLVGGDRHLQMVPAASTAQRLTWADGLDAACEQISRHQGERVVVLASGDPLHYGIGARLVKHFGVDALSFRPAPGAFSLAAARMGWSIPDVVCLTVHGRPLESVNLHLAPDARLLILSWDGTTPAALGKLLTERGFGDSVMTVLEHMDGALETRVQDTARNWSTTRTADLNTIAVDCVAAADAVFWPRLPGLPEAAFRHDGMITKREVRAATLAALSPLPGQLLWDIGAGSGAVAIEWLRAADGNRAVAFEKVADKCQMIRDNAYHLGVPDLRIIDGDALTTLPDMADGPDAVFVGGGVSNAEVLALGWQRLNRGGRLVANAVTLEAQHNLMAFHRSHGGDLTRISVARSGSVGRMTTLRPALDVLQLRAIKP